MFGQRTEKAARMVTFHLTDRFPRSAVLETKVWYERKDADGVLIASEQPTVGLPLDLDTLSKFAGLIISVISLCLTIHREIGSNSEKSRWTAERLQQLLKDELLALNVREYEIVAIQDFERLRSRSERPCTLVARDKDSGRNVTLYVFYDGSSSYTISRE